MKIRENGQPETRVEKPKGRMPKWLKAIGVTLLVLVGLVLVFNKQIMEEYVLLTSTPDSYLDVSKEDMAKNAANAGDGNFDSDSAPPVSAANLVSAALDNGTYNVIGGISMPALNINLPIYSDYGDYAMFYGAGALTPDQRMGVGNFAMASHDMWTASQFYSRDTLFSPLQNAENGQDIYLTDKDKVYHYVVSEVKIVAPTAWDEAVEAIQGKTTVTLITCEIESINRILVRGELKDVKDFNDKTAEVFTGEYNDYRP